MADDLFHDVSRSSSRPGVQRPFTVLISIAAHTAAMATAIIVPVLATGTDVIPIRKAAIAVFALRPPLPPAPPPPMNAPTAPNPEAAAQVPVVAPDTIAPDAPVNAIADLLGNIDYTAGIVTGAEVALAPPAPPPPPPAAPVKVVRPGGEIKAPIKISDVPPVYPSIARMAGVQGVVILEATIDTSGSVQDVRVLRPNPLLEASAVEAVRQWKYTPTLLNGSPVAVVMTVTVNFTLK